MGVKTHLSVNLPQSVNISGAEINLTLRAVTTYRYVLCCNLAPSMSALKMCKFSNIVMKWQHFFCGLGHTVWCVIKQTSRVKDLSSLVIYDDSCLAAVRHVQSILRVVRPRPNIYALTASCSQRTWHVLVQITWSCYKVQPIITKGVLIFPWRSKSAPNLYFLAEEPSSLLNTYVFLEDTPPVC